MQTVNRRQFLRNGGAATIAAGGLGLALGSAAPAGAAGETSTFEGIVTDQGGQVFNVTHPAYGAKGDTIRSLDGGSIAAGSFTFTQSTSGGATQSSQAPVIFDAATDLEKVITVQGAGLDGKVLSSRIRSVDSPTTVTLWDAASTTVAAAQFSYGTDDTVAIVKAIAAAGDRGTVYFPGAIFTIVGASNDHKPVQHNGRGGMRGCGGTYTPAAGSYRMSNTVFLCSDATAAIALNGCARYEGFMCDGNNIATTPLLNGLAAGGAVTAAPVNATFSDIRASQSARTGWTIYGARNCSYFECGTSLNGLDGIYIDGGASGLDFIHFHEQGNARYGLHGNHLVSAAGGSTQPTKHIRFYSGLCDGAGSELVQGTKVYLRNAIDWGFPEMLLVGITTPVVDLDQSAGYDLDFTDCRIITGDDNTTDDVGIKIVGSPTDDTERTFIKTGGAHFPQAGISIQVLGDPRRYKYSAVGGWFDPSRSGPVAAAGLPGIDTMFTGRMGEWQTATAVAPWTGTLTYRITTEREIELRGSVQHSGTGVGPICNLPLGYRPDGATRVMPVATSAGPGIVEITTAGDVTARLSGGGSFAANATVHLGRVRFSIDGQ